MSLYPEDKKSAFIGLIGGAIVVLVMVLGLIQWTNTQFAGHETTAEATK
ncbi:MAG: hypothetical protein ACYC2G_04850 [Gemmatimonadaceae bacterium]